jgi:hypothetical protein
MSRKPLVTPGLIFPLLLEVACAPDQRKSWFEGGIKPSGTD